MEGREGSLPLMDVDSLPDEMLGVDDMLLDSYFRNMEGAPAACSLTAKRDAQANNLNNRRTRTRRLLCGTSAAYRRFRVNSRNSGFRGARDSYPRGVYRLRAVLGLPGGEA